MNKQKIVHEGYEQYQWISDRFSKIKGVELVMLNANREGVNLLISNNLTGTKKKVYEFPLRRLFFVDYALSEDCPHPYSIMELDDPNAMVEIGVAKAEMFFNNQTIQ